MKEGRASRTAEHNALFRALESALPARRRLFEDPLARRFLSWPYALVVRLSGLPGLRELVPGYIDSRWPGARPALVARTRLIDDVIVAALDEGPEQLVMLGAGFDSRAYRLPGLRGLRVFEVDTRTRWRPGERCWSACCPDCRETSGSSPSTSTGVTCGP